MTPPCGLAIFAALIAACAPAAAQVSSTTPAAPTAPTTSPGGAPPHAPAASPAAGDDTHAACLRWEPRTTHAPLSSACKVLLGERCAAGDKGDCDFLQAVNAIEPNVRIVHAQDACATQSVSVCQALCDGGDLDACVEIGQMYVEGRRAARDIAKGGQVYEQACAKGSFRACYLHGATMQVLDPKPAARSFKTACESDAMPFNDVSCTMLVAMIDRKAYAPPLAERVALLRRMCARAKSGHGDASACGRLKDLGESP